MPTKLELLTIQEAAEKEGVSRQTIYYWINHGVLGYIQKGSIRLLNPQAVSTASQIMAANKKGVNLRKKNRKKTEKKLKNNHFSLDKL